MTTSLFLLAAMFFASPQQSGPPLQTGPLRVTFLTAAETVLDQAMAIDPAEPDAQFRTQLTGLKQSQQTLREMAEDEREQAIASEANTLTFSLVSCHLQVQGDASRLTACKAQVDKSANNVMQMMNVRKTAGGWLGNAAI